MNGQTLHAAMKDIHYCIAAIYCLYAPEASAEIVRIAQTFPDFGRDYIAVRRRHIINAATAYGKGDHDPDNPWDIAQRSLVGKLHILLGIYAIFFHEIQAKEGGPIE